jgi:hypothetical protein
MSASSSDIYTLSCSYIIPRAWFTSMFSSKWRIFGQRYRVFAHSVRRLVDRHNQYTLNDHYISTLNDEEEVSMIIFIFY